ncbi:hypothetical protein M9H77_27730 [Catharanthus roseus]|uniref:Uncharacterized protein n=1 Tax=Catharanthus roseus TaxID=4058 RepID=A0ACC0AG07_CATRO|nr:hypothetical protein M9H77_27730 [Catharanthus roseus]
MKNSSNTTPVPDKFFGNGKFIFFLFLLVLVLSPTVRAQPSIGSNNDGGRGPYGNFSPSMAIIIVVLVAALFFMGFFSIYIRHCSDSSGSGVRNVLSMRGRRGNAAARGLDASVIETFPTFSYAEVKDHKIGKGVLECAVCLNEFEDDETLRLLPKCDHVFHPECIDAWLESHVTCPVCRANLTPQPDDQSYQLPEEETNQENPPEENNSTEQIRNDDVTIQVSNEQTLEQREEDKPPQVKRNFSLKFPIRPPRTESVRRGKTFGFGRFRSHSTGHSLVQPGENVDRFTLRLPEEFRKEMMNRALLNRATSTAMGLPRNTSSRRGTRTDGSSRGMRSYSRIERAADRSANSDRWVFSKTPPFFSRALSSRSPRVSADNAAEGSTSSKNVKTAVKMPSFKCLEPKSTDEAVLVRSDSIRPPV